MIFNEIKRYVNTSLGLVGNASLAFPLCPRLTFIAISETKLKSNYILNVDIPCFNFIYDPSQTNSGGVGLYINSNLT